MVSTLSEQSLSKAHRERIKRVARGVLVAIGIALCIMPDAGGEDDTAAAAEELYTNQKRDNTRTALDASKTIATGDVFRIATGSLSVTLA